ncbi:MAG: adenine deaminase [Lachnospiraceae bacterium]|nr:adenine deaminase [Lachnospiraceae bacterium]
MEAPMANKTLLKNGSVINVFTGEIEQADVLMGDGRILGVGDYEDCEADVVEDVSGSYICPGFIDGHIHVESTTLTPYELARTVIPHGTTAIVADPHEIANVSGMSGIAYMIEASEGLPMTVYMMLPSCVPATPLDESGATLEAKDLRPLYQHPRVLGLGEMMNYPGVIAKDERVLQKIADAHTCGKLVNGHAPLLSGKALDKYIAAGIQDDHECSSAEEAKERIRKGQWVMIREGTAARNLADLLPLFEEPWSRRCLLVTDDKHPADLIEKGHIDGIIRKAAAAGKPVITGIQMATLQAAQCFGLRDLGAVAPGYQADILVLSDLDKLEITDVFYHGRKVVNKGRLMDFKEPAVRHDIWKTVRNSFCLNVLTETDFRIAPQGRKCRVIRTIPDQLLTEEMIVDIDFSKDNGVDVDRDILKLAVIERHLRTGHIGLGFISGIGMKKGAIASSVSHDSHNLIVIGADENDMTIAANRIRTMGGGLIVVADGEILAEMPLPVAGLMSQLPAADAAGQNEAIRRAVYSLGVPENIEPFMTMAFVSLPVIPSLKMTTRGLVDVGRQEIVSLFV